MKPVIGRGQLDHVTEGQTEPWTRDFFAHVWTAVAPPHGIEVDQRRIGDRYLELLAERRAPVRVTAPRTHSGPGYQMVVDETHAEFFRRWQAVLDSFRWYGARQSGKTELMTRFLDEAERLTGIRPTHIRANLKGDVFIAPEGANLDDPQAWTTIRSPLASLPERVPEKLEYPWQEVGHTAGGGTVWVAPLLPDC